MPLSAALLASWGVTMNKDLVLDMSGIGQIFGFSEVSAAGLELRIARDRARDERRRDRVPAGALAGRQSPPTRSRSRSCSPRAKTALATSKLDLAGGELELDPKSDKKGPLHPRRRGVRIRQWRGEQQGRFVVVGSSGFASNSFLGFNGNRDLFST